MRIFKIYLLLCLFVTPAGGAIQLTISDSSSTNRIAQYVSYAIPLAFSDAVTSTSGLAITTDSAGTNPVDTQFDIISRYDNDGDDSDSGDPIRTVLCTFKADVLASSSSTYYLQTSEGSGNPAGSNLLTDETGYVEIDTGKILARISKTTGNIFDYAIIDTDNDSSYADETAVVSSPSDDGWFIQSDEDGESKLYSSNLGDAPTIIVHYNGPLMALIEVSGNFKNGSTYLKDPIADGKMEYKLFYKLYKDEDYVLVNSVLRAEDHFGNAASGYATTQNENIDIDYSYIRTSLNLFTPAYVRLGECVDNTSPSGSYVISQTHVNNNQSEADTEETPNFSYTATGCTSGTRFDSYAGMDDGSRGVSVASRWFWQKWPKGISVDSDNDRIDFYLWPDVANDHVFHGATWKTHEMVYYFGNDASEAVTQLKHPLRIVPSSLATSNFFDAIPPNNISTSVIFNSNENEKLQPSIDKFNAEQLGYFDSSVVDSGLDFNDIRESRPFAWTGGIYDGQYASMYGWYEFGDFVRAGTSTYGFGSQNYNWGYIALVAGLRFNSSKAFELADQMARQYGDVLIIHDVGSTTQQATSGKKSADVHGGQRNEWDALDHKGSFIYTINSNEPGDYAHAWPDIVALQYMLTGDPYYLDVMEDIGQHLKYNYSNIPAHYTQATTDKICTSSNNCYVNIAESRVFTNALPAGVLLWYATGESDYLTVAEGIYNKAILPSENNNGYMYFNSPEDAHMLYEAEKVRPIILLANAAELSGNTELSSSIDSFIGRVGTWMKDSVYPHWADYDSGVYNGATYFPYITKDEWDSATNYVHDGSDGWIVDITYSYAHADIFAWLYKKTGLQSWLDLARAVFKDGNSYLSSAAYQSININDPLTTDAFAAIPGTAWLKDGKITDKPMYYLYTESAPLTPATGYYLLRLSDGLKKVGQ